MIVALQGGLGNQMFQYAYGISNATDELFFTRNSFLSDPKRTYQLHAYELDIQFTDPTPETLYGYWQSEKYFDSINVRKAFAKPKGYPPLDVWNIATQIADSKESAFVGVRHGDYVTDEAQRDFHGCLPLDYYQEAMSRIRIIHPDVKFFVFSDDVPFCRENFPKEIVIAQHDPWWDIWLMALCKHAVIANSSFHWWGAWLGKDSPERMVIAPKQWFKANVDSSEIVPARWKRL